MYKIIVCLITLFIGTVPVTKQDTIICERIDNESYFIKSVCEMDCVYLPSLCENYHYYVMVSCDKRIAMVTVLYPHDRVRIVVRTSCGTILHKYHEFNVKPL